MDTTFKQAVDDRTLTVGVIGLGYVGLPLILALTEKGFPSVGFDIDMEKIDLLKQGKTYLRHIPDSAINALNDSGLFDATDDYSRLKDVEVIIICVPTPLDAHREPDLKFVVSTTEAIRPHLRKGHLVTLESTTYPGTTDEVLKPILEESGLVCGEDFYLAYSPEREDPGNLHYSTASIPKVVGGYGQEACDRATYLFSNVVADAVPVSSTRTAEAVKLTENIFRSVNIALVNELKMIYTRMGIDTWEVIDAAKTKPFGFMPFYPGPGLGGHCIPIDPFYLTWKAREYGSTTRFIETAGEINTAMPEYVVMRLMDALNDRGTALKGARMLVIGIAYKKDVGDHRESPSFKLMEILHTKGAVVDYHDSFIPVIGKTREYMDFAGMTTVDLTPENIAKYDAVLIATNHTNIDYDALVTHANLVVDTRNATRDIDHDRDKIVKA